jgi:hypothetical protein
MLIPSQKRGAWFLQKQSEELPESFSPCRRSALIGLEPNAD